MGVPTGYFMSCSWLAEASQASRAYFSLLQILWTTLVCVWTFTDCTQIQWLSPTAESCLPLSQLKTYCPSFLNSYKLCNQNTAQSCTIGEFVAEKTWKVLSYLQNLLNTRTLNKTYYYLKNVFTPPYSKNLEPLTMCMWRNKKTCTLHKQSYQPARATQYTVYPEKYFLLSKTSLQNQRSV